MYNIAGSSAQFKHTIKPFQQDSIPLFGNYTSEYTRIITIVVISIVSITSITILFVKLIKYKKTKKVLVKNNSNQNISTDEEPYKNELTEE